MDLGLTAQLTQSIHQASGLLSVHVALSGPFAAPELFGEARIDDATIVARGRSLKQSQAAMFASIQQRYGVPPGPLLAIWGMETGFGAVKGNVNTLSAVATLAYDCRRSEMFRAELIDALKIVDRGDMRPAAMKGAWAGELGQTQFMPSSWLKYAVDFDGDGKRDLIKSVPDVLASTANLLHTSGFKMGQPFGEGTANFQAMREWNRSEVYRKTIGYFAEQLMGR